MSAGEGGLGSAARRGAAPRAPARAGAAEPARCSVPGCGDTAPPGAEGRGKEAPGPWEGSPGSGPPRLPARPRKLRTPRPRCRTPLPGRPQTRRFPVPRFPVSPPVPRRGAVRRHSPGGGRAAPGRAGLLPVAALPCAGSARTRRHTHVLAPTAPRARHPPRAAATRAPHTPRRAHACTRTRSCTQARPPFADLSYIPSSTRTLPRSCLQPRVRTPDRHPRPPPRTHARL